MSAVAGLMRLDGEPASSRDLERMANALSAYGPDRAHVALAGPVGFAHVLMRMTPEDRFDRQPLRGSAGELMTADLRLDNRDEILDRLGISRTDSLAWPDAQVLFAAWQRFGNDVWRSLRGAFAVAIFNPRDRTLTLARDHLGHNVVMWHKSERFFAFATMPKGLFALADVPREVNEQKVADFLVLNHREHETTFYRDVHRLPPAHIATIDRTGQCTAREYWSPAEAKPVRLPSDEAYADARARAAGHETRAVGCSRPNITSPLRARRRRPRNRCRLVANVVNAVYAYRNFSAVIGICAVFFVVMTAKGLAVYGQAIILARVGNAITAENQRRIFKKLLHENLGYFADRHSAEFVAQVTFSASAAGNVLALLVTSLAGDSLTLFGLVTVMVVQDPVITLFALVAIPAAAFLVRDVVRRIREVASRQYTAMTGIMESVQETVRGLRTIKAFTLEEGMERRIGEQTRESQMTADKLAGLSNRSTPLMETLGGVAVGLLALYVGYRVIYGGAMAGELLSCVAAFLLAYEPIKRLTRLNVSLNGVLFGVQTFYGLVDAPAAEAEDGGKPHLSVSQGRIEFAGVDFGYRAGAPVLRKMTFVAEPGEVTALVGPSGGGKSTVVSLILRLYEAGAGQIAIDGQNVATVSRTSLRRQISYVGQDVFLFRGTIRENIGFGRPNATEHDIAAAAAAAHAHEFIMAFPKGYDTPVGEHGLQLSTGQRQRVSIARALLKDAPLILLDEPTAALDSESERHLQDAIARLCSGRTTMVIAHRLQTIMHADRILFVEHGAVVESGSHHELLRRGGRYAAFHRLQFDEEPARRSPGLGLAAICEALAVRVTANSHAFCCP